MGKLGYGRLVTWLPRDVAMRLNIKGSLFWGVDVGVSSARPKGLMTLTVNSNGLLPAQTTDTHTGGVHLCGYVNAVLTERCWGLEASPQGGAGFRTLLSMCVCVCVCPLCLLAPRLLFWLWTVCGQAPLFSAFFISPGQVCVCVYVNVYLRTFVFVVIIKISVRWDMLAQPNW